MNSLLWTFNRLLTMAPEEIVWRGKQAFRTRLEHASLSLVRQPPAARDRWGNCWCNALPAGLDAQPYKENADRVLSGKFNVFALHGIELGFPPRWNQDPKTRTDAPLDFGKTLNYRDERIVGDIKYLWEINRHYELVTLAQAFHLSREPHYADACRLLLQSWMDQCPYPLGQGWSSSLENAVRLLNWAVAWHLLGGAQADLFRGPSGEAFKRRWLDAVYQQCQFIAGHFSLHSSANNHLFGEYMGLFIASVTWPCWQESAHWRKLAHLGLEMEALKQNAEDGVNREQAIWYHHEVADMMLLVALFGQANGVVFSPAYLRRLESMLDFIASVMDVGGAMPMIGDSDDAMMVRFCAIPGFDVFRSLLATGSVLFNRSDFKAKAGIFDDKSRWLLGDEGEHQFARLQSTAAQLQPPKRTFPQGGYYILGRDFDTPSEIKLIADAGPLGYLSIAAHGHADALSFTLSAGGRQLLIDPGTYAYHTQKKWRDYFRGTAAHNTVAVDGRDQSESGGNFMWLRKAKTHCEAWDTDAQQDCLIATHDGYLRLPDPVRHRRKIVFLKSERIVIVEDTLECQKPHLVDFHWHFADTCKVVVAGNEVKVSNEHVQLEMTMPDCPLQPRVVVGREEPPLGWTSHRFDHKAPSPTVVWQERISGTQTRKTAMRISFSPVDSAQARESEQPQQ